MFERIIVYFLHQFSYYRTFLRQDELEADTLKAQQEEEERKKRLEEQRAFNADLATLSGNLTRIYCLLKVVKELDIIDLLQL